MGRRMFLMVLLTLIVIGVGAQTLMGVAQASVVIPNLMPVLAPLIVMIVTPLLARLFRKMGIDIEESVLEPILMRLIEIISQVEKAKQHLTSNEKKELVTELAKGSLSPADQRLLVKRYGSLETAVQAAFERSSVALK